MSDLKTRNFTETIPISATSRETQSSYAWFLIFEYYMSVISYSRFEENADVLYFSQVDTLM
jgi:hypothetical protein